MLPILALVAPVLGLLGACGVSIESPYILDDLKFVAVVAEPPDAVPGQSVAMQALIAAPHDGSVPTVQWSYCAEHSATDSQDSCADPIALAAQPPSAPAPGMLQLDATLPVDASMLSDVPADVLVSGFWLHVHVKVTSPNLPDSEAIKRVVLRAAGLPALQGVPNANPILRSVGVWDLGRRLTGPLQAPLGAILELVPDLDTNSFAAYVLPTGGGALQARLEVAQLSWYVGQGSLSTSVTQGNRSVLWTLPSDRRLVGSTQRFAVALRDGRGGAAVASGAVQLMAPGP